MATQVSFVMLDPLLEGNTYGSIVNCICLLNSIRLRRMVQQVLLQFCQQSD
jgi:hypothetical protein